MSDHSTARVLPSKQQAAARRSSLPDLTATKRQVEALLATTFASKINEAHRIDAVYGGLWERMSELVKRGGKRLRPQLVILAYVAYGGKDLKGITQVAAAQELFHAFILMHDDIIDRDSLRWGGLNISGYYHKKLVNRLAKGDAQHYADAWALLAGDACFNLSNELLLGSGFSAKRLLQASALVQQTLFEMVGGELLDVALPISGNIEKKLPSQQQLLRICHYKTATYSFCTPLQLGALMAGADAVELQRLKQFGIQLGIAFQLRDDVLGMFGDESRTGKSTLGDLREGKGTLLMTYGLELANNRQRPTLIKALGNTEATRSQLQAVRHILESSGALAKTEAVITEYQHKAQAALARCNLPHDAREYLTELTAFCCERSY